MTKEEAIEKLKISKSYFKEMPEFHRDREIIKFALEGNGGYNIKYLDDDLKHDKELVMIALESDPMFVKFVPEELKNDPSIKMFEEKLKRRERAQQLKKIEEEKQHILDRLNRLKDVVGEEVSKAKFISEQFDISLTDALLALQTLEIKNMNTKLEDLSENLEVM